MADAGFRLTVEGEKEFRKAIGDVNAILRLNQAELQKVTAEYNASEKGMDDMSKKQNELGEVLKRQTDAVAQMEGELERLTESYGESDKGVIKMRTELDKAKASLANMQAQFKANAEEIRAAGEATEAYTESMEDIDAQIKAFAAEIKAMDAGMKDANGTMSIFGSNAEETAKQVEDLKKKGDLLTSMIDEQKKKMDTLNDEMEEAVKLYGSQSREVAEYREEIANATVELKDMEKQLEDNNDEIKNVETGAGGLVSVFDKVADITGVQIPDGLTEMLGGVGLVEGAVAGGLVGALVAAVGKVIEIKQGLMESAAELTKLSWETGLDTETLQALQGLSEYFGVDVDTLKDSLKDLRKNMVEAVGGNEELMRTFNRLGVSLVDNEGQIRDVLDVYLSLSNAFMLISDKEARLVEMEKLLGESANQSAQIASAGKEELLRVMNMYYDNYQVRSSETIKELEAEGKAWEELKITAEGYWNLLVEMGRETEKDEWWKKILATVGGGGAGYIIRYLSNLGDAKENFASASRYASGEGSSGGTVNNYNVTISASDVREFNDIVRLAQSKRVTERMQ